MSWRELRNYSIDFGYVLSQKKISFIPHLGFGIIEYKDSQILDISPSEINHSFVWARDAFSFLVGFEARYYYTTNSFFGLKSDIIFSSEINHTPLILTIAIGYEF